MEEPKVTGCGRGMGRSQKRRSGALREVDRETNP